MTWVIVQVATAKRWFFLNRLVKLMLTIWELSSRFESKHHKRIVTTVKVIELIERWMLVCFKNDLMINVMINAEDFTMMRRSFLHWQAVVIYSDNKKMSRSHSFFTINWCCVNYDIDEFDNLLKRTSNISEIRENRLNFIWRKLIVVAQSFVNFFV